MNGTGTGAGERAPIAVTPGQLAEARRDLGRQLAAWRGAAGLTQVDFAHLACYSRSSVGNVETGRQTVPRRFWQHADRELGAGGVLLAASDHVEALARDLHAQAGRVRDRERRDRIARRGPAVRVAAEPVSGAVREPCGCAVTVGRWTGCCAAFSMRT